LKYFSDSNFGCSLDCLEPNFFPPTLFLFTLFSLFMNGEFWRKKYSILLVQFQPIEIIFYMFELKQHEEEEEDQNTTIGQKSNHPGIQLLDEYARDKLLMRQR
jgi:hypothetical protein